MNRLRNQLIWLAPALVVLLADIASKEWALWHLAGFDQIIIPNYFELSLAFNTGVAFSLFSNVDHDLQQYALVLVALAICAWLFHWQRQQTWPERLLVGLIIGGALGNVIDRLRFGAVVDFISVHYQSQFYWPTFNIADSAICLGVALLLWRGIFGKVRT